MFLRKKIFCTFLILYEIPSLINAQEYLNELKAKDFKHINDDELSPVELPRPIIPQRLTRTLNDEQIHDELTEYEHRLQKSQRPTLMDVALQASVREGLNAMRRLYTEVEPNMVKNGQLLQENHPAALLSKFSAPLVETTKREMAAYATLTAAKVFRKSYDLSSDLARQAHSQKVSLRRTALESLCPPRDPPTCMPASARYRTHDGTCNNKRRLRWGAAQMPFNRFLPPEYGDGVDTIRRAADGRPLSSSRFVSLLVHGARDGEAPLTLLLVQWGQLLDHDMTSTAQPRSINGSVPSCCGSKDFHPSCFPIKVPLDDPWLSPLKLRCLEFLRSAPAQRRDCVLSWREQTNQATSYIDASPIYSSSVKASDNARVFRKGLLIFGRGNPADDVCQRGAIATHCIRSGDGRSSEQPGLLALHHVWVHEHNSIAMKLSDINLHWSDEKIYQETRRIIGAMFQHITYREFLPIVLGREVLKLFDLELLTTGYYEGYDVKTNPTVSNAFSAAAFRFGHSLVQDAYWRCDRFHNVINNNVSLHEEFQRGDIGSAGSLHRLLRGMATQRALKRDEFITPELTNHLFQTPGFPFGLDLAAINIQRGRDHGIPPYTHWRQPCGLSTINSWEEMVNVVGPESAQRISHAYHSVHDIDLFVGGIAERPVVGGLVGPTFACIIAQQFSNSRKGDRFWYENDGFESSFTPAQLHSIRRVSLASVLCRAVGGGTFQPHIFLPADFPNNERLPCNVTPLGDFDIGPWLEQDPFDLIDITHTAVHQPPTTTFKPHILSDRIFDVMHLETKSPSITDTPLSNNKVEFSNHNPAITVIKGPTIKPNVDFIPNASSGGKINDKLDLKKRSSPGHVTKQKPIPGVNNKLDKNNRKGGNRNGIIQSTTRRTIIVHNIPIELRNADRDKVNKKSTNTERESEPRIGSVDIIADTEKAEHNGSRSVNKTFDSQTRKEVVKINKLKTENEDIKIQNNQDKSEIKIDTKRNSSTWDDLNNLETPSQYTDHMTSIKTRTKLLKSDQLKPPSIQIRNTTHDNTNQQQDFKNSTYSKTISNVLVKQTGTETITINNNLQYSELKNVTTKSHTIKPLYDSDIDPIIQATPIEHKRVQRKLIPHAITDPLRDKLKIKTAPRNITRFSAINNRTQTTKSPKLSRTTVRTVELRQYQSRPSFTKAPQKLIVDSVNGDSQYEIEINIRQTNKSPKPIQSTPHVLDYTNGYKPNQFDRYTNSYQTTPIYAYYQPAPTQISTLLQNKRTKPPTIIFVNEHEEHKTSKLPAYLQNIVGWNLSTKRPLSASIGFSDKPGFQTVIGSPHSPANVQQSVYQKPLSHLALPPASSSSLSQAQLGTAGLLQASSASISQGNFGSITGFASANGADSIFSFNIRPKPDTTQSNIAGSYGLVQPQSQPWYEPSKGQQISTYDPQPYRENVNSPFSNSNLQKYHTHNPAGPQRKDGFTLTPPLAFADYDYALRTLHPLSNLTSDELTDDKEEDYEYDEDYGSSALLRNFNNDGYLTSQNSSNLTINNNQTFDDNYVLPVLNCTRELQHDLPLDVSKPIPNTTFSTDFPEAQGKNFKNYIFAEDDNNKTDNSLTKRNERLSETMSEIKTDILRELQRKRKRNHPKNNKKNHEKIAFAPITILTKPERPDNWVFFDSPQQHQQEPALPRIPELIMDLVPSAEIPKPLKINNWLDLSKIKRKLGLQFPGPLKHLAEQTDSNTQRPTDVTIADMTFRKQDAKTQDTLKHSMATKTVTSSNKQTSHLSHGTVIDSNVKDLKTLLQTDLTSE